jgi:hypothetical protein
MISFVFLDFELDLLRKTVSVNIQISFLVEHTFLPVSALLLSTLSLSLFSLRFLRLSLEVDRSLLLSLVFSESFPFEERCLLCSLLDRECDWCRLRFDGRRESSEVSESDGEESDDEESEELRVGERPRRSLCSCFTVTCINVDPRCTASKVSIEPV